MLIAGITAIKEIKNAIIQIKLDFFTDDSKEKLIEYKKYNRTIIKKNIIDDCMSPK